MLRCTSDLVAFLMPAGNENLFSFVYRSDSLAAMGTPRGYYVLSPHRRLVRVFPYRLPPSIIVYDASEDRYQYQYPVRPGKYFLRARYWLARLDDQGRFDEYIGSAGSNRIELCISDK